MADEHHEEHDDHGNTVSAWFLTVSWIVAWTVAAVAIMTGGNLVTWTVIGLVASVALAVVAGVMKKAGLGRKEPRPVPPTREEWEAGRKATTASGQ
ncbi:HGxxPAAW family protein [Nocardiopsis terrae]